MEFEESIYNLIPKEAYVPPKPQRHISKHNPMAAPTASTFCLKTTSKPGLSNMTGDDAAPQGHHTNKSQSAQFGLPKGAAKPDASTFRLKNTGTFKLPDGKYLLQFLVIFQRLLKDDGFSSKSATGRLFEKELVSSFIVTSTQISTVILISIILQPLSMRDKPQRK